MTHSPDISTNHIFETGFEQGSIAAVNAILAYLDRTGPLSATALVAAWDSGAVALATMTAVKDPPVITVGPTDIGPPAMSRDQARSSGFTGNVCAECGSLHMVRNGTCEKCESCGCTTGCS